MDSGAPFVMMIFNEDNNAANVSNITLVSVCKYNILLEFKIN